jgi:hypothetical protein
VSWPCSRLVRHRVAGAVVACGGIGGGSAGCRWGNGDCWYI